MTILQISNEKKLSKQAVTSLISHAFYQFGNSFSTIFVNLYLWRLTNDLVINGLYNLVAILAQGMTTFFIGRYVKKKNLLLPFRMGIVLTALFYLFIITTRENIIHYVYFFAILKGIGQSTYWLGYFVIIHDVSNNTNRHRYLGWNSIVMNGGNLLGPAIAGGIIGMFSGLNGYIIVFAFSFILFLVTMIGSLQIKKQDSHHKTYYMKYIGLMFNRNPDFLRTLIGWFILGFPQGILMYIPSILLFTIFHDEKAVGNLNIFFLSLSIFSSYLISRFAKVELTVTYLFISSLGLIFSSFILLFSLSAWTVVLFMATNSLFNPLQQNAFSAHYYKWIGMLPLKEHFRVESIVLRESIINFGRGMGIVIFMLFTKDIDTSTIPWIIVSVMVLQIAIPFLAKEKKQYFERYYHSRL